MNKTMSDTLFVFSIVGATLVISLIIIYLNIWHDAILQNSPYCQDIVYLNKTFENEIGTENDCKIILRSKVDKIYNEYPIYDENLKCKFYKYETVPMERITRCKK